MIPDLKPELNEMVRRIGQRNTYHGNKISPSIMRMFETVEDDSHIGVLVPYWLSVLQEGRGPRKSSKDHKLVDKIYAWMSKRNMFRSQTPQGRRAEAKGMTWYINKYGNKQFRSKTFVDIYKSERERTIKQVDQKFLAMLSKITMEIL